MDHKLNFYEALANFLKTVEYGKIYYFSESHGREITGRYWPCVCRWLSDHNLAYPYQNEIDFTTFPRLENYIVELTDKIESIKTADIDRALDNEEKRCNIKYGRRGFYTAIVSIIISSVALLLQLLRQ